MAELEKNLNAELLVRTTHSVKLTKAGEAAFHILKKITEEYTGLTERLEGISSGKTGNLIIASLYYGIEDFVEKYLDPYSRKYPDVNLSLLSLQANQVLNAVEKGECDLGYAMYAPQFDPDIFEFFTMQEVGLNVITREKMVIKGQDLNTVLAPYTMLNLTNDRQYMEVVRSLMENGGLRVKEYLDVEQVDLISIALKTRNTYFIGPDILREMSRQNLNFYPIEDTRFKLKMGFYYNKNSSNPCIHNFLKTLE